ncbi:TPA: hypothetical protein KDX48_002319 [Vibrio parahaemolyticus]|nr:hypothetical protein [Vibrio parahaemolyticus]
MNSMIPAKIVDLMTPSHDKLVFIDKESADKKDLMKSIGRFDEQENELALLGQSDGYIQKIRALYGSGVRPRLIHSGGNYYVATDWSTPEALSESNEHKPLYTYKNGRKELIGVVQEFDDYYDIEFESDIDTDIESDSYEIEEQDGELVIVFANNDNDNKSVDKNKDKSHDLNESNKNRITPSERRSKMLIKETMMELKWN